MPGCYLRAGRGYQPDSAQAGSPGQSPLSFSGARRAPSACFRPSPLQPSGAKPSPDRPLSGSSAAQRESSENLVPSMSPTEQAVTPEPGAKSMRADPETALAAAPSTEAYKDAPYDASKQSMQAENSSSADQKQDSSARYGASSNGVQGGELATLSGLSLADGESTEAGLLQEQTHSTRTDSQPHRPSSPGNEAGYHAERNDVSAAMPGEAAKAAEHAAPEEAAVAQRAEHAAAAIAAEGLELDRSSEPAAIAAARSGSLAPGLGPSPEHLCCMLCCSCGLAVSAVTGKRGHMIHSLRLGMPAM